jgi:predicted ester cyclase
MMNMSIEENKALATRWMKEIWQEANPTSINELVVPGFFFNYGPPGAKPDREVYKQTIDSIHAGFPDLVFTTEHMIAEGDKVAVHWKGQGTHTGEFWGVPPSGNKATMEGISIIRIEDSKIVEEWGCSNMLELMQQVGAIPPPG